MAIVEMDKLAVAGFDSLIRSGLVDSQAVDGDVIKIRKPNGKFAFVSKAEGMRIITGYSPQQDQSSVGMTQLVKNVINNNGILPANRDELVNAALDDYNKETSMAAPDQGIRLSLGRDRLRSKVEVRDKDGRVDRYPVLNGINNGRYGNLDAIGKVSEQKNSAEGGLYGDYRHQITAKQFESIRMVELPSDKFARPIFVPEDANREIVSGRTEGDEKDFGRFPRIYVGMPKPQMTSGQVSEHFYAEEFYQHGSTLGAPVPELLELLEILRAHFGGAPVKVNSGYRSRDYNRRIGGASQSQHCGECSHGPAGKGLTWAADIRIVGVSPSSVAAAADSIFDGVGRYNSFTHVDVRGWRARW